MDAYTKTTNVAYSYVLTKHDKHEPNHTETTTTQPARVVPPDGGDTFSGYRNPYWRSEIERGVNATTTASGTRHTINPAWFYSGVGLIGLPQSGPGIAGRRIVQESWGLLPPENSWTYATATPPGSLATSVANSAIRKFLDQADQVRSSCEAGQDFGELKQTLESMINPLGSLRSHVLGYFSKLSKAKKTYRKAVDLKKALADTYLEWHFGWKPLAEDVANAYVGLQNRQKFGSSQPIHASASGSFQLYTSSNYFPGSRTIRPPQGSSRVTGRYSVRYKGAIRVETDNDGRISRNAVLQLDLPHFLPTAWDLIPYSFIADYFANIGDIIRAYSFQSGDLSWGCKTVRTTILAESNFGSPSGVVTPGYVVEWEVGPQGNPSAETVHFTRSAINPGDLIPKFQFRIPVSSTPWVNMSAILLSRTRSLVPFFI
jgi:hypothetical protein